MYGYIYEIIKNIITWNIIEKKKKILELKNIKKRGVYRPFFFFFYILIREKLIKLYTCVLHIITAKRNIPDGIPDGVVRSIN